MMNKLKLALVSSALVLAGTVGVAAAKGGYGEGGKRGFMWKFDANGDGVLDDAERAAMRAAFAERRAKKIAKYDTNRDGQLDAAEQQAMKQAIKLERFQALDVNKDGRLTLAELEAGMTRHAGKAKPGADPELVAERQAKRQARIAAKFAALDVNKDGTVSLAEFQAGKHERGGKRGMKGKGGHGKGAIKGQGKGAMKGQGKVR
jgi:hypothetical protein